MCIEPPLPLRDARRAPGQLGHDHLGIDAVGEHVAMVAIAGDDAVLAAVERRLQPDRDRFLADVEVAEAADQAEAVELAGLLLEAADQQHLPVEFEQLVLARLVALRLAAAARDSDAARGAAGGVAFAARFRRCCFGQTCASLSRCGAVLWRQTRCAQRPTRMHERRRSATQLRQ